ncbi:MAG: hypothetical protein AAF465_05440 [Pseudomonadota bacterium]
MDASQDPPTGHHRDKKKGLPKQTLFDRAREGRQVACLGSTTALAFATLAFAFSFVAAAFAFAALAFAFSFVAAALAFATLAFAFSFVAAAFAFAALAFAFSFVAAAFAFAALAFAFRLFAATFAFAAFAFAHFNHVASTHGVHAKGTCIADRSGKN